MNKQYKRDTEQAAIVLKVARITGVSKRYVNMVINGERISERVLNCYMEILESQKSFENKLLTAVKELIPF